MNLDPNPIKTCPNLHVNRKILLIFFSHGKTYIFKVILIYPHYVYLPKLSGCGGSLSLNPYQNLITSVFSFRMQNHIHTTNKMHILMCIKPDIITISRGCNSDKLTNSYWNIHRKTAVPFCLSFENSKRILT